MSREDKLLILSAVLAIFAISAELCVLFIGVPKETSEVMVGRVLGTLDTVAIMALQYHYSTSAGSTQKTALMAAQNKAPPPGAGSGA